MTDKDAIILVIAAASGTGKSSLARALAETHSAVTLSVSHTSREMRRNEVDGRDYFFISEQSFLTMIKAGHFVEHAKVYGNYYGTSKKTLEDSLDSGVSVLLDIDWQGAQQVASHFDCAVTVFLLPPSIDALKKRLIGRDRDSEESIKERLQMAVDEMRHCIEFDHIILNDDFDAALMDLEGLLPGSSGTTRPLPDDLFARLGIQSGVIANS